MKNFITIITNIKEPAVLRWGNNDQELTQGSWLPRMEICIDECKPHNVLWIENDSYQEYEISDVIMFGFGQGKIKYWGKFSSQDGESSWLSHVVYGRGKWSLEWQYPTFTWLHHCLGMGWLVKPAD